MPEKYFADRIRKNLIGIKPQSEFERLSNGVIKLRGGDLSPIPEPFHNGIFERISAMLSEYTTDAKTQDEMLVKSAADLKQAFLNGSSVIFIHENGQRDLIPIAHATIWPLVTLDKLRIFEFGSWIVDRDYRHHRLDDNLTLGEEVAIDVIDTVIQPYKNNGSLAATISTVKRLNSLKGLLHVGFEPVRFHEFPMVSGATCTCPATSEHFNYTQPCHHRRDINHGEIIPVFEIVPVFQHVVDNNGSNGPKIPCTLLCDQPETLTIIEAILQTEYRKLTNSALIYNGRIGQDSMHNVSRFYERLGVDIL